MLVMIGCDDRGPGSGIDAGGTDASARDGGSIRDGGSLRDGGSVEDASVPRSLMFTEYVEGGESIAALEITNLTDAVIPDLSVCALTRYDNGTIPVEIPLDAAPLPAGESFVLCQVAEVSPACDQIDREIDHNGNDPYVLTCEGVIRDIFGYTFGSPSEHFTGTNSLGNLIVARRMTLVRLCGSPPDTVLDDTYFLEAAWDATTPADPPASEGDVSGLGEYSCPSR